MSKDELEMQLLLLGWEYESSAKYSALSVRFAGWWQSPVNRHAAVMVMQKFSGDVLYRVHLPSLNIVTDCLTEKSVMRLINECKVKI
ncbi:MAG: hypothetical protein HRU18_02630 [Pseudoalteromonas sp.]|uniref:hypothetical protein n=1 Tax=Pseudoalteromonas sp. TaxID=53249 RepID=UPI001DFFB54C|nr:hypothetical protein [Pseudoalteromonas sp.]NRA77079.1 hypothetical protein [Pseudoalteromonas sp.]